MNYKPMMFCLARGRIHRTLGDNKEIRLEAAGRKSRAPVNNTIPQIFLLLLSSAVVIS